MCVSYNDSYTGKGTGTERRGEVESGNRQSYISRIFKRLIKSVYDLLENKEQNL